MLGSFQHFKARTNENWNENRSQEEISIIFVVKSASRKDQCAMIPSRDLRSNDILGSRCFSQSIFDNKIVLSHSREPGSSNTLFPRWYRQGVPEAFR